MPLIENPLSTVLEQVLRHQNARQDAIASNIANANTPGYKSFDLVMRESSERMAPIAPRQSSSRHMSESQAMDNAGSRIVRSDAPARLDGNNVSMEEEFMKMTENRMRYQAIFEMMDKWGGLMPIAREVR
ncbi:MAG: flagellar basal body rod protein FlgB [bacterium]|nr:flagellar basal body rod protein FlgB [bacterium]